MTARPQNTSDLKTALQDKTDQTIQRLLTEWMDGYDSTPDEEAIRLLAFVEAWYLSQDKDSKTARVVRDNLIKAGVTEQIHKHIRSVLQLNNSTDETLKLLQWGLYGSSEGSPKKKQERIFNTILKIDFETSLKKEAVLSDSEMAEVTSYSRKTIRKYRDREDFKYSLGLQLEAFHLITGRYD